jgi:hypothetical protein
MKIALFVALCVACAACEARVSVESHPTQQNAEAAPTPQYTTYAYVRSIDSLESFINHPGYTMLTLEGSDGYVFLVELSTKESQLWKGMHTRMVYQQARNNDGSLMLCHQHKDRPVWEVVEVKHLPGDLPQ